MTNQFVFELHPKEEIRAAAEGVTEDVIAAVLLLHDRSVDEVAPQLSATELERVITLVGRSPRQYPRGMLETLRQRRSRFALAHPVATRPSAKREVEASAPINARSWPICRVPDGAQYRAGSQPTDHQLEKVKPRVRTHPRTAAGLPMFGKGTSGYFHRPKKPKRMAIWFSQRTNCHRSAARSGADDPFVT